MGYSKELGNLKDELVNLGIGDGICGRGVGNGEEERKGRKGKKDAQGLTRREARGARREGELRSETWHCGTVAHGKTILVCRNLCNLFAKIQKWSES
jgi:hypothetical protein